MFSRRNGFTLLEICLALMIGLLLITLAVPGIAGVLSEQRLQHSFEVFDRFVQEAKIKSLRERRDYVMAWDEQGITLLRADAAGDSAADDTGTNRMVFEEKGSYSLQRTAALTTKPPGEWTFWKSGICEPARISYQGDAGNWTVLYDPLTVRGVFIESEVK